jgi:hypothetical protein
MRRWFRHTLFASLIPFAVCAQTPGLAEQLDSAEAKWNRLAPANYEFTFHYGEFVTYRECESWSFRAKVVKGKPRYTSKCATRNASLATVPLIFKYIRTSIARNPGEIDVTFDPIFGFPVKGYVGGDARVADDYFSFDISGFTVTK